MRKVISILVILLAAMLMPVHASVSDILKGSADSALSAFARQVMPVDGWAKVKKGEALVVEGAAPWNPDYYVVFKEGKVHFWGPVPTGVDVRVKVYKVYFGVIALPYNEYDDIWWTKEKVGSGWTGDFFVWNFDWKWFGEDSDVGTAYIAYDSPDITDLSAENLTANLTMQSSPGLKLRVVNWESMRKIRLGSVYLLG